MTWLTLAGAAVHPLIAEGSTPDIPSLAVSYALRYGPVGVVALVLGWLLWKGWRVVSPKAVAAIEAKARADLLAQIERQDVEIGRLRAERNDLAEQRDDGLKFARDQLMPLLTNFTSATQALLPILQNLVSQGWQARHRDDD